MSECFRLRGRGAFVAAGGTFGAASLLLADAECGRLLRPGDRRHRGRVRRRWGTFCGCRGDENRRCSAGLFFGVDFVDRQEERRSALRSRRDEFEIGRGEFGASVDDHDDGGGFVEGDSGLAKNFRGMKSFSSGRMPPVSTMRRWRSAPFGVAVEAVAGDAGLVADDGAARAHDAVEQRGLADVGAADDGEVGTPAAVVAKC